MIDITELFMDILHQTGSVDMAEAEFKHRIADDPELRDLYRQWCHEVGSSERRGFLDFCDDLRRDQNEAWDILRENEDE